MNHLNLNNINLISPYAVWQEGGELLFKTDYDILYSTAFEQDESLDMTAYWFRLTNRSGKKSPGDKQLPQTIICIIEEFFRANPDILLYMCDSANEQQAQRDRLFLRWFNGYEQKQKYAIRTALIMDDGEPNYIALIIQRSHPDIEAITQRFDSEIAMFQENKP